jgi:hypothetical protein
MLTGKVFFAGAIQLIGEGTNYTSYPEETPIRSFFTNES